MLAAEQLTPSSPRRQNSRPIELIEFYGQIYGSCPSVLKDLALVLETKDSSTVSVVAKSFHRRIPKAAPTTTVCDDYQDRSKTDIVVVLSVALVTCLTGFFFAPNFLARINSTSKEKENRHICLD